MMNLIDEQRVCNTTVSGHNGHSEASLNQQILIQDGYTWQVMFQWLLVNEGLEFAACTKDYRIWHRYVRTYVRT